jgi:preprotein translocase subunit YajC
MPLLIGTAVESIGFYFLLFLFFFVLISAVIYVAMIVLRKRKQHAIKTRVDMILKARSCIEPFCSRFRKKE